MKLFLTLWLVVMAGVPAQAIFCQSLLVSPTTKAYKKQYERAEKSEFIQFVDSLAKKVRDKNLRKIRKAVKKRPFELATINGQQKIEDFLKQVDQPSGVLHPRIRSLVRMGLASAVWYYFYAGAVCNCDPASMGYMAGIIAIGGADSIVASHDWRRFREDQFIRKMQAIMKGQKKLPKTGYLILARKIKGRANAGLIFGRSNGDYILHILLW